MGLFTNRSERIKRRHRASLNWPMLARMMTFGHELGIAESEGLSTEEQGEHAADIVNRVLEQIGEDAFVETLIAIDLQMNTRDKDAVLDRAFEVSGYNSAREDLFGTAEL